MPDEYLSQIALDGRNFFYPQTLSEIARSLKGIEVENYEK